MSSLLWFTSFLIQQKSKLHMAITVFLAIKICATLFLTIQWFTLKNYGQISTAQQIAYNIVRMFEMTSFLVVLVLIADGWGIVDNKRARRWPLIALLTVLYCLCLSLELFFSGFFSIATAVALCAMLFLTFVFATDTMRKLAQKIAGGAQAIEVVQKEKKDSAEVSSDDRVDGPASVITEEMPSTMLEADSSGLAQAYIAQARKQLTVLSRYRFVIMLYICGQLVCSILNLFSIALWISQMVSQLFDILLYMCIGFIFLLRKEKEHGMYYLLETENADIAEVEMDAATDSVDDSSKDSSVAAPAPVEAVPAAVEHDDDDDDDSKDEPRDDDDDDDDKDSEK